MYSSLRLAREPEDASDDGRLEARELIQLPLQAELAVLSACETGRGRVGGGEGMIGLSWALLVAGARNTVVSQWRVDAASSEALMVGLHRRLLEGRGERDAAVALRASARAVRADARFRHPFYWAGFALVGSGRISAD
jgi:CHAT domain-containing protein